MEAESRQVFHGLIAGVASGLLLAVLGYIAAPSIEEVIQAAEEAAPGAVDRIPRDALEAYLRVALLLSGPIVVVVSAIVGAVLGWIAEVIESRLSLSPIAAGLAVGLAYTMLITVPNIAVGAMGKAMVNLAAGAIYTMVYLIGVGKGMGETGSR